MNYSVPEAVTVKCAVCDREIQTYERIPTGWAFWPINHQLICNYCVSKLNDDFNDLILSEVDEEQ